MGLLSDSKKLSAFESLLTKYRNSMSAIGSLDAQESNEKEAPTTDVWLNYLLAQYYNFKRKYQVQFVINIISLFRKPLKS